MVERRRDLRERFRTGIIGLTLTEGFAEVEMGLEEGCPGWMLQRSARLSNPPTDERCDSGQGFGGSGKSQSGYAIGVSAGAAAVAAAGTGLAGSAACSHAAKPKEEPQSKANRA